LRATHWAPAAVASAGSISPLLRYGGTDADTRSASDVPDRGPWNKKAPSEEGAMLGENG
jgi:hypothetical protein